MENADSRFVKAFFLILSWIATTGPLIYALVVHQWLWLALVVIAEAGAVVSYAIKQVDNSLNNLAMTPNEEKIPNPGSDEALDRGCTCPVLDNGHGNEELGKTRGFWISGDCPIHAKH